MILEICTVTEKKFEDSYIPCHQKVGNEKDFVFCWNSSGFTLRNNQHQIEIIVQWSFLMHRLTYHETQWYQNFKLQVINNEVCQWRLNKTTKSFEYTATNTRIFIQLVLNDRRTSRNIPWYQIKSILV